MNAASILRYLAHKRIINIKNKEMLKISKLIGSDVMLGLNHKSKILNNLETVFFFPILRENFPLNEIKCFFDLIFLIKIMSCKSTKLIMLSILCKDLLLLITFNAKFNFACDFILEKGIKSF